MDLKQFMNQGVKEDDTAFIRSSVKLANTISIFSIPLCAAAITIGIILVDTGIIWSFLLTGIVFLVIPLINRLGLTTLTRVLLSILPPILVVVPTYLSGNVHLGHIIAYSYAIIGLVLLPIILIDFKTERTLFVAMMLVHLAYLLVFDLILATKASPADIQVFNQHLIQLKMAQGILYLFVIGVSLMLKSQRND